VDEARRRALIVFGGVQQTNEAVREVRGTHFIEVLALDVRYAGRILRKSPAFTAVAVLTLALGIGMNAAIFSVINAVLIEPLPFPDPSRIVAVFQTLPKEGIRDAGTSFPNLLDWQKQGKGMEAISAIRDHVFTLTGSGDATYLTGVNVSSNLFTVLQVTPMAGRSALPASGELTGEKQSPRTASLLFRACARNA
jgi:MacB-like periplasmic core domain